MPSAAHQSSSVPREVDDSSIQVTSFVTALSLSSLDRLRASRLLPPRSGLERSDFVLWPIATEIHVRCYVGGQGKSGLVVLNVRFVARDPQPTSGGCAYRKSNPDIFVMQSAEDRAAQNTPCRLYGARQGSILVQSQVRARLIIVASVRFQYPA